MSRSKSTRPFIRMGEQFHSLFQLKRARKATLVGWDSVIVRANRQANPPKWR